MDVDGPNFSQIVAGLRVNGEAFRNVLRTTSPPRQSYVVMFTARSGSTWLTKLLASTDRFGFPEEYLNADFIRDEAVFLDAAEPGKFLTALTRRRQTWNGIFGMEARCLDIHQFGVDLFFEFFDRSTIFFNLWRDNIVAQALSLYRAVATRRYHSNDGQPESSPPPYDAQAITGWLLHLAAVENENVTLMQTWRRPFTNICYERMVADQAGTLRLFADRLEVALPDSVYAAPAEDQLKKIGDAWNLAMETQYRADYRDYIAHIEASRLVKLAGASSRGDFKTVF